MRGIGEAVQVLDQTRLALGQPLPGFERNRQPGPCGRCFDGRQGSLYIAIAPGVREPDVAGAEVAALFYMRDAFPKPTITGRASVYMLMPPGIAAHQGSGHVAGPASDSSQRCKDMFAGAGSLDLERAQHARRIAPEPVSSEPRRPHLAVEFVREHMRWRHPGKASVQERLFDLPQQSER